MSEIGDVGNSELGGESGANEPWSVPEVEIVRRDVSDQEQLPYYENPIVASESRRAFPTGDHGAIRDVPSVTASPTGLQLRFNRRFTQQNVEEVLEFVESLYQSCLEVVAPDVVDEATRRYQPRYKVRAGSIVVEIVSHLTVPAYVAAALAIMKMTLTGVLDLGTLPTRFRTQRIRAKIELLKEEYEFKKAQLELANIADMVVQPAADQASIQGDDRQVRGVETGASSAGPGSTGVYKAEIRDQIQKLREVHGNLTPHFVAMRYIWDDLSRILHESENADAKAACAMLRAVIEQSDDLLRSVAAAADSAEAYIAVV